MFRCYDFETKHKKLKGLFGSRLQLTQKAVGREN